MGILCFNGKPIATEVGIISERRATMIQTAYNEEFRDYSVGAIVMMKVLEHLVNVDRIDEIDFGRDDQPYKKLWLQQRRERWCIIAFNLRTAGGVRLAAEFFLQNLNQGVRDRIKPYVKPLLEKLRKQKAGKTELR